MHQSGWWLYRDGTGNGTGVTLTSRQLSFVDRSMFDDLTGILKAIGGSNLLFWGAPIMLRRNYYINAYSDITEAPMRHLVADSNASSFKLLSIEVQNCDVLMFNP